MGRLMGEAAERLTGEAKGREAKGKTEARRKKGKEKEKRNRKGRRGTGKLCSGRDIQVGSLQASCFPRFHVILLHFPTYSWGEILLIGLGI